MRVSLNGSDWRFKYWIDAAFLRDDAEIIDGLANDKRGWHTGTVPGSVHHDLWQCGEIPDPYYERNSLLSEWVPDRTWVYTKTFALARKLHGRRAHLHFVGVDYEARFFLNGTALGRHTGMFTPAIFDVTDLLSYDGPNVLAVVIAPAPHEQGQLGRTSLVRTHKTRMNYWWDFCPRIVHVGVWDEVYLEWTGAVSIKDVWARPTPNADRSRATVTVSSAVTSVQSIKAVIEASITYEGRTITCQRTEQDLSAGEISIVLDFEIVAPRLWWPNGYGEQALYQAVVRVEDHAQPHETLAQRTVTFGIRQIELVPNDTPDVTAPPYTFVVNGVKLYINGWNWVPMDVLYGVEQPAKLERLLKLAQQAHVNLLRVNGVGLIEKDSFYDQCNRLGMMVWQEFILSSSALDRTPSKDPAFIQMIADDAREIIPRKRNHPSLVIWGGGNELESLDKLPLDDNEPVLRALRDVVTQLDPDRHWLPTSAFGRKPFNGLSSIARDPYGLHDVHGPWLHEGLTEHYSLYNAGTALFHTEFGAEGLTNLATLNAVISQDQRWPVTLDNAVWRHLSAWWVRVEQWQKMFGSVGDLATLVQVTQWLQAEGVRYAIEANRRRMYQNSGALPWQLNEPYPMAACTSAVDYFAEPKPLYYAVRRAFEPLQVSAKYATLVWPDQAEFEAEVWLVNAYEQNYTDVLLQVRIVGARGTEYQAQRHTILCNPNQATKGPTIRWPLAGLHEPIFLLDLQLMQGNGTVLATNRYPFSRTHNLQPLLQAPRTTLEVSDEEAQAGRTLTIKNTGQAIALFVQLMDEREVRSTAYTYFSDNHFCLFPGESRAVIVEQTNDRSNTSPIMVMAWNAEGVEVA